MKNLNPIFYNDNQKQQAETAKTTEAVNTVGGIIQETAKNKATSQDVNNVVQKLDEVSQVTQANHPAPVVEKLNKIIENTMPKKTQEVKFAQPPKDIANAFFSMLVPKKGEDYYTDEEAKDFLKKATPVKGVNYRDGYDPKLGKDYFTGEDISNIKTAVTPVKGKDYFTKKEVEEIKTAVKPIKGKDYNDGKNADEEVIVDKVLGKIVLPEYKETVLDSGEQIVGKLNPIKNALDFQILKNIPDFALSRDIRHGGGGGGGQVITFQDEGTTITENPVTKLNIVGSAGSIVYTGSGLATLTLSGIVEEITSTTDSATPTPTGGSSRNFFDLTALAQAAAFAAPSGTPANTNRLIIRIKDDATARALTWDAVYVAGGVALPSTTVLSKILTLGFIYNTANTLNKWQCVASSQEV